MEFIRVKQKGRELRETSPAKAKSEQAESSANVNEGSPLLEFQVGLSKSSKISWVVRGSSCLVQNDFEPYISHKVFRPSNSGETRSSSSSRRASNPRTSL